MNVRAAMFRARSYTPLPLLVLVLIMADPSPASLAAGGFITLAGESIRLWAVGYAGSATRTRHVGASVLITNGPYAYVRNPIYDGNFILSLGLCIMAWAWMPYMLLVFVLAFGIQYGLIVSLEEAHLRAAFPVEYGRYAAHVPRFLPNIRPYPYTSTLPFDLRDAFRSDRRTFQSIFAVSLAIAVRWYLKQ
ncbi:MAG: isoprenylcysteine carboxylmethyltransferase family protein [Candidatus Latescibacteria bacterium]|nr:isoprenylcysteine carboxylmethyltransferase family protein [Candidatus Latescibacterota bacterium]